MLEMFYTVRCPLSKNIFKTDTLVTYFTINIPPPEEPLNMISGTIFPRGGKKKKRFAQK